MARPIIFICLALVSVASAQIFGNDGRYRAFQQRPVAQSVGGGDGRYRGSSDGSYTPDNSGAYKNDGQYYPDNSGRYNPDDSGRYSGKNEKYQHVGGAGGQYTGSGGQYTGTGGGAGSGSGFGSGAGSGFGSGAGSGFGSGAGAGSGAAAGAGAGAGAGFGSGSGFGTGSRFTSVPVPVTQPPVFVSPKGSASGKYDNRNYAILKQVGHVDEDGYHYLYETENGILGEEQGKLHNRGTDSEGMKANGFYEYTGPDNVVYRVTYTADENGFIPEGNHLPTPPPIPEPILRMLEWQRQQGLLK